MDVTDDVVDVVVIHNDLADAFLDEKVHQFVYRSIVFDGNDFGSGHDAVAHLDAGEIEGVLENLHFGVDLFFVGRILDTGLDEVVEVYLGKGLGTGILVDLGAGEAKQQARDARCNLADGVEHHIAHEGRQGEDTQGEVRVDLKECLRHELACNQYY